MRKGDTYRFLNTPYTRNKEEIGLQPGDEVIIHPIQGRSQATKSYPAIVVEKEIPWVKGDFEFVEVFDSNGNFLKEAHKYPEPIPAVELCLKGIRENSDWSGAVINDYAFSRLEFVKRTQI